MKALGIVILFTLLYSISTRGQELPQDELELLCSTESGVNELLELDPWRSKPDQFQTAALRNQGADPAEYYRQKIQSACANVLAGAPNFEYRFDTTIESPELNYDFVYEIKVGRLACSASWDELCEKDITLTAPTGMQMCGINFYERTEGEDVAKKRITPTSWFHGDEENPDRFRAYHVDYWAQGSKDPIFQRSAKIVLSQVRFYVIDAELTNEDRFRIGCHIPLPPNPSGGLDDIDIPPPAPAQ